MSISLGCCRRRMPKQLSYLFEAEPARNEMGRLSVPVVVPAIVCEAGLMRNRAPELLDFGRNGRPGLLPWNKKGEFGSLASIIDATKASVLGAER